MALYIYFILFLIRPVKSKNRIRARETKIKQRASETRRGQ